jgi:hypothetical protein
MPRFIKPKPLGPSDFKTTVKHPAPVHTETEKQIYSYLKNVPVSEINNHLMQEWQLAQRYESITDEWGKPVHRKRYWGELQDASSVYQLEKDRLALAKFDKQKNAPFRLKTTQASVVGMVNNFQEYKAVKEDQK